MANITISDGIDLATAEAHLADALEQVEACRASVSLGKGDQQLTRAQLPQLERSVGMWSRRVRELRAQAAGATEGRSGFVTATWDR